MQEVKDDKPDAPKADAIEEKKDIKPAASKADAESLQIYARIRKIMPWEPAKKAIKWSKKNIEAVVRNNVQSYQFSRVFKPNQDNEECFNKICKPMAHQVLDGFNAVLIAYGQTGSGKTHSLLGKPKRNVLGILPMVIEFFMKCPNTTVTLGAVEAFGHHVNRIELYDLFNENCQSRDWSEKQSKTSLAEKEMVFVTPKDAADGIKLVSEAQKASHYAPTGKNPESSRGHISFIVRVVQDKDSYQKLESYFIIVDLAGSEGETAFTPEFKAKVDPSTLMARRLEAGVINTGLSQLQIIFNELKVKGRLSKMVGVGLRRVLHPYINARCVLSVLFCISPSQINLKSTVATLKFAVQAGMVSVRPVKEAIVTDWVLLVKGLKEMVANLNKDIDERDVIINQQEEEINRLTKELASLKRGQGGLVPSTPSRRVHSRQRSQLPDNIKTMMDYSEQNAAEEDGFDEKDTADVDEFLIDKELEEELGHARGEKEAVAAVLGVEKEEFMRTRSNIFTSMNGLDSIVKSLSLPRGSVNAINTFGTIGRSIDQAIENFETNQITIKLDQAINLEQDNMATNTMDRATLIERCEVLESMLEAEKALNASMLYSQQVIIDHLAETNEGLLQFFRVKLGLLDNPEGTVKKKKTKKRKSVKDQKG